jgi:hypothetical protein
MEGNKVSHVRRNCHPQKKKPGLQIKFYTLYAYHSVHSESISKNSNKMTLCTVLYYFLSVALHVSGISHAHHQELN